MAGGLRVAVRVTPRGGRDGFAGVGHDADERPHLKLRVAAAPVDGEANDAVVQVLAKALGVPRSSVSIVGGTTAREKTVLIDGDPVKLVRLCQVLIAGKTK